MKDYDMKEISLNDLPLEIRDKILAKDGLDKY